MILPAEDFPLTDEKLAEYLATCNTQDPEKDHANADELLCKQLTALGFPHSVSVYRNLVRWYA